jgi:hypothetical protein
MAVCLDSIRTAIVGLVETHGVPKAMETAMRVTQQIRLKIYGTAGDPELDDPLNDELSYVDLFFLPLILPPGGGRDTAIENLKREYEQYRTDLNAALRMGEGGAEKRPSILKELGKVNNVLNSYETDFDMIEIELRSKMAKLEPFAMIG